MSDFTFELAGEQFRRAYLLYIIEIRHSKDRYFYIGQTGDNHYVTARPAFRRLFGHLEDSGGSTQNQIYKYIATKILSYSKSNTREKYSNECKQAVEDFLVGSIVRMHVYNVLPFNPAISRLDHLANVKKVTLLEKYVIKAFADSGKSLINKAVRAPIGPCPYPRQLARIKGEFDL